MPRILTAIESSLREAARVTFEELQGAQNMRDALTGAKKLREHHIEGNPKELDPLLDVEFVNRSAALFIDYIQKVSDKEIATVTTKIMLAEAVRFGIRMSEKFHDALVLDVSGKPYQKDR